MTKKTFVGALVVGLAVALSARSMATDEFTKPRRHGRGFTVFGSSQKGCARPAFTCQVLAGSARNSGWKTFPPTCGNIRFRQADCS